MSAPKAREKSFLRRYGTIILLAALVLFGLIGAIAATGWEEARAQLAKLGLWQVVVLLALSLMNYLCRGVRWHLYVRHLGVPLGLGANLRHFFGGFAMTVTPARIGEFVRMRWIARETGWAIEKTAPLILVDRASDLLSMALLIAATLVVANLAVAGAVPVIGIALAVALVATRPGLLARFAHWGYQITGRAPRLFARAKRAARSLERFSKGGAFSIGTGLALIGWFAEGYAFYLLLDWLGADVGMAASVAIFLFATLAGGMTGTPGGLGGAEAAMVALLTLQGVPLEISLPATAIIRLTTLWFAIGLGACIFPYAERRAQSA